MHLVLFMLCCLVGGTAHATSGAPLRHAAIALHGPQSVTLWTDAQGHFSGRVSSGVYSMDADAPGYAAVRIATLAVDHDVQLDIALEPVDASTLRTIGQVTVDGRLARISGAIPSVDVTRTDLDRVGADRVVAGLLSVPSLDVQYPHNAGTAGLATVSLRGPDPSETMVTLDGQLLNDANTGDLDVSQLPVAAFNAISVTEGLGPQDLEGSGTIGGAVNFISLQPTRDPHSAAALSAGSFGQSEAWYNATGTQAKLGYAFALDDQQETGYIDQIAPVCSIGGAPPCPDQHLGSATSQRSALLNLDYTFSQEADIGARIFTLGDVRDESAAITGYQNVASGPLYGPGPQTFGQSIRAYQVHGRLALGVGELVGSAFASDNNVDLSGGGISNPFYDISHQDTRTGESLDWERDLQSSSVAIGGFLRQESFVAPGAIPRLSQSIASYFARGAWTRAKLHLGAGLYESRYSTFGSNLDGRFAAVYDADARTAVRFSLGTGFRAPLLIERYVFALDELPPPDNNCVQVGQGNPNEQPEHATEYELGVSHDLSSQSEVDASLYQTNLRDPIENFYPLNTFNAGCATTYTSYPINIGNAVYQGAELRYSRRFAPAHLFLTARYGLNVAYPRNLPATVSNPTSGATLVDDEQFPDIPQQQASLEVDWANAGWHAAVQSVYRGLNNPLDQGPLLFVDAALGKQIDSHLDVTLAGTNIFNTAAGQFQVFDGGVPYRGLIGSGELGPIPTNLLTVEPAGLRLTATFKN